MNDEDLKVSTFYCPNLSSQEEWFLGSCRFCYLQEARYPSWSCPQPASRMGQGCLTELGSQKNPRWDSHLSKFLWPHKNPPDRHLQANPGCICCNPDGQIQWHRQWLNKQRKLEHVLWSEFAIMSFGQQGIFKMTASLDGRGSPNDMLLFQPLNFYFILVFGPYS